MTLDYITSHYLDSARQSENLAVAFIAASAYHLATFFQAVARGIIDEISGNVIHPFHAGFA